MNLVKWLKMDLQENLLIAEYGLTEIRPDCKTKRILLSPLNQIEVNQ